MRVEDVKRDIERLKEFSFAFAQMVLFFLLEYVNMLLDRHEALLKLITEASSAAASNILPVPTLLKLLITILSFSVTATLMVLAEWKFFSIVVGKVSFFHVDEGLSILEKRREEYEEGMKMALWGVVLYIVTHVILRTIV